MVKRIVIFNHKGGVSKTTTAYNIGWMLARNAKVLLVDADPQCNLSNLVLGDDFERYYTDEATRFQNIKDGVSATFDGKPTPITAVSCASPERAPTLRLLAGHANLSEYDAALTFAQTSNNAISTLQNLPGAFAELLRLTEEKYEIDYTIIDLNPSLSAINQNLFLISDTFLVPTNPDPFSIMALNTLATILPRWVTWKKGAVDLFQGSAYPLPTGTPKFIGTVIQRFNIRRGKAARPYRDNIGEIKEKVATGVFQHFDKVGMVFPAENYASTRDDGYCLAEIADFQGLLPKSYEAGVPVFDLTDGEISETGPILENFIERRNNFETLFTGVTKKILNIIHE